MYQLAMSLGLYYEIIYCNKLCIVMKLWCITTYMHYNAYRIMRNWWYTTLNTMIFLSGVCVPLLCAVIHGLTCSEYETGEREFVRRLLWNDTGLLVQCRQEEVELEESSEGQVQGGRGCFMTVFLKPHPQPFMKHKSHAHHAFIYTKSLSFNVHITTTGQKGGGYHGNSVW